MTRTAIPAATAASGPAALTPIVRSATATAAVAIDATTSRMRAAPLRWRASISEISRPPRTP